MKLSLSREFGMTVRRSRIPIQIAALQPSPRRGRIRGGPTIKVRSRIPIQIATLQPSPRRGRIRGKSRSEPPGSQRLDLNSDTSVSFAAIASRGPWIASSVWGFTSWKQRAAKVLPLRKMTASI